MAAIEGIRKGCIAVFGVRDAALGTERLVVVAETRDTDATARERLQQRVLEAVADALGVPPDTVVLARPGAVLKTSSGKVRRAATRDAYLAGTLDRGAGVGDAPVADPGVARGRGPGPRARPVCCSACPLPLYIVALTLVSVPPLWALVRMIGQPATARRLLRRFSRFVVAMSGCRLEVRGLEHLRDLGPAIFVRQPRELLRRGSGARHAARDPPVRRQSPVGDLPGARDPHSEGRSTLPSRRRNCRSRWTEPTRSAPRLAPASRCSSSPRAPSCERRVCSRSRLGAFRAAVETGRPLVPVAISGTRHILSRPHPAAAPGTDRLDDRAAAATEGQRVERNSPAARRGTTPHHARGRRGGRMTLGWRGGGDLLFSCLLSP